MRPTLSMRLKRLSAVLCLVLIVGPARAADPVPDVDVVIEQPPGNGFFIEVPNGAPFDSFRLSGPRDFIGGLEAVRLPSGWSMSREGKRVVLSGPAVSGPTRIQLRAGRTIDKSVDWDVSIAGRSLASRNKVVPRSVPQRAVKNSLQGVVAMPDKVSPGEAVALRPLPAANLPPGRFVLSGVVTEPLTDEEVRAAKTGLPVVGLPPAGFVLGGPAGTSCRELLPLAAALVAGGATGECAYCKSFFESRSNTAKNPPRATVAPAAGGASAAPGTPSMVVNELRSRHDVAMNAIRNIKSLAAVEPAGSGASFTIDEKGVKLWEVTPAGAKLARMQVVEGPRDGEPQEPQKPRWVALDATEVPAGCLFTGREPDLYDLAVAKKAGPLPGNGKDTVETRTHVGRVPDEMVPGTALSLQYLDLFGDAVVDVPVVSDTEVVPPAAKPQPPCVTAATAYAQAEDTVCVCGNFPTLAAQSGLWVDERDAGAPVSVSTRTLQYQLPPHAVTVGRHVWSGNPEAGFATTCRAQTQVVLISGELDSQNLFSGQSTPMRLTVAGTADKVPIRIKNLTPAIIRIDGGEVQTVESSGGSPNQVIRSVQGLVRGAFNVEWSLATDRCPCP